MSTVSASASSSASASASPFSLSSHLSHFFSPVSRSSLSSLVLDGYRSVLCLWMISFHCIFFMNAFQSSEDFQRLTKRYWMVPFELGYLAVDGFFVLTGFLLALPLFEEEKKFLQKWKEDQSTSKLSQQFSIFAYWWRRFSRLLPVYALALAIYCVLFHPYQYDKSVIRSENLRWFMDLVAPEAEGAGANCALTPFNFLHLNHLLPFGGCLGVTWSFAIQFHFYVLFPIIWKSMLKRFEARLNKFQAAKASASAVSSPRSLPSEPITASSELIQYFFYFVMFTTLLRCFSYFHLRTMPLQHPIGMFMGFFWYCNAFLRLNAILVGVYLAKVSSQPLASQPFFHRLQRSALMQNVLNILSIGIFVLIGVWNYIFSDGQHVEVPGESAIRISQEIPNHPPTLGAAFLDGFSHHFHHFIYYSFFQVSSIGSVFMFSYFLLISIHSIGWLGRSLAAFLSKPIFRQISALSMFAYFLHPTVMIWVYNHFSIWFPDWVISPQLMAAFEAAIFAITFSASFMLHILYEQPLEHILRRSDRQRGFFMKVLFWLSIAYGFVLVLTSTLGNLAGFAIPFVTQLPDGIDFSFRRPDNVTQIFGK